MKIGIYKKDQGRFVRLVCFGVALILVFWTAAVLYDVFPSGHDLYSPFAAPLEFFGVQLQLTWMLLVSAGVFFILAFGVYLIFNWPKLAEFMIETEGELKKVTWPEKKEYIGASIAVIAVVVFIVFYLYAVDIGLSKLLTWTGIGF